MHKFDTYNIKFYDNGFVSVSATQTSGFD